MIQSSSWIEGVVLNWVLEDDAFKKESYRVIDVEGPEHDLIGSVVLLDQLFCSISMMNIHIKDGDLLDGIWVGGESMDSSNEDVVKDTKTTGGTVTK